MDREERQLAIAAAAHQKVADARRAAIAVERACDGCHWLGIHRTCAHVVYRRVSFDRFKGKHSTSSKTSIVDARNNEGLCGPDGELFEPAKLPAKVRRAASRQMPLFRLAGIGLGLSLLAAGIAKNIPL